MLTDEQLAALKQDLAAGPLKGDIAVLVLKAADADVADAYNAKAASAGVTLAGVMSLLSPASIAKLVANPNLTDIRDKIKDQDITGVSLWGQMLLAGEVITADEHTAITAAIASLPQSRAEQLFGPGAKITAADVGAAR